MKSEYYLATVVGAYRRILDGGYSEALGEELNCAARRAFTTAYALGANSGTEDYDNAPSDGKCTYIANVLGGGGGRVLVEMRNRFREGDRLEILSPNEDFGKEFVVTDLRDGEGNPCEDAKLVQANYSFSCPYPLQEGDILRKRTRS